MKLLREEKVPGERSITDFLLTVQDEDVRSALKHYSIDGILGSLLDARHDGLITGNEHWTVFEIEHLMEMGEANLLPVLLYLFRRIEKSLNGRPTMLILDEAWLMLGHPAFRAKIREWLKVLRKANCLVCMATQSLTDAVSSGIFDVLIESCPTKILLPNPEADKAGTAEVPGPNDLYTIMGLNSTEINMLKNATRKRDYYFTSAEGKRMFTLGLDSVALNFVAVNYKDNHKLIREFMEVDGQGWPFKWLEHKGINYEIKTH
jgi:type IV secretion system protein VirB4